jgi:hypothetical protein
MNLVCCSDQVDSKFFDVLFSLVHRMLFFREFIVCFVCCRPDNDLDKTQSGPDKKRSRPKDVFGRSLPTEQEFEVLKNAPRYLCLFGSL